MLDAHEGEHRGVEVVDVDDVLDGAVTELVRGPVDGAGFDATAGEEDAEAEDVVVAAAALAHRGAAEFAAPQQEGVFQHAALLEVGDEGRGGLVDVLRGGAHAVLDAAVVVPSAVVELDHADAAFGQTAGHQAVRREGAVADFLDAVVLEGLGRLVLEIEEVGHAGLHLEGQFILGDAGRDLGVDGLLGKRAVEATDLVDDLSLGALADALGVADVVHGFALGLEEDALVLAWQDAAGPLARGDRLEAGLAGGGQHDVAGEVLGLGA